MNFIQMIDLKRAVLAIALLALVASAGFLSTRAFFSDTETSAGNVFAAGSLDLMVGIDAPDSQWPSVAPRNNNNQQLFAIGGLMPGQQGGGQFRLLSEGADTWACVAAEITANPENTRLSQEQAAGDTSAGGNSGELKNYMEIAIWEANGPGNADGQVGPNEIDTLQVMSIEDFANGDFHTLQDSSAIGGDNPLIEGQEYKHEFAYCLGEFEKTAGGVPIVTNNQLTCDGGSASNVAQTDGIELTMSFYAEQMQNNDNFTCGSLNGPTTPPAGTVGALLTDYTAPACTVTVGSALANDTIQEGVNSLGGAAGTVCVEDGVYTENVSTTGADQTIVALNPQGATINGGVRLVHDNATLQGFVINGTSDVSGVGGTAYGVHIDQDDALVANNQFIGSYLGQSSSAPAIVTTYGSTDGAQIINNSITGFGKGIYLNPGSNAVVKWNDIFGNDGAISSDNPAGHSITLNDIRDNDYGIGVFVGAGDSITVTENNITNNGADDEMGNYGSVTFDATNNWWGDVDGSDDTDAGTGPVTYDPEATSEFTHR